MDTIPLSHEEKIRLAPYALDIGYDNWIYDMDLSDEERVRLSPHAKSLGTIKFLLDSFTNEELELQSHTPYEFDISYIFGTAGHRRNMVLLHYLLDRGFVPNKESSIVGTGNLALIQKLHSLSPLYVDGDTVRAAILSGSSEVVRFIIEVLRENDTDIIHIIG